MSLVLAAASPNEPKRERSLRLRPRARLWISLWLVGPRSRPKHGQRAHLRDENIEWAAGIHCGPREKVIPASQTERAPERRRPMTQRHTDGCRNTRDGARYG